MHIKHNSKLDRLLYHTEITDSCWNWLGIVEKGYGRLKEHKRWVRAHRYAYELFVSDIPKGLTVDHLCYNRRCVNPEHMELVSASENSRRGALRRWSNA